MAVRVLVCGGRDYRDVKHVKTVLDSLDKERGIALIIEGGASGADCYAAEWADDTGVPHMTFHADWDKHGRAAGPIRNQKMLEEGKPDLVIAFPGGRGTEDMIARAKKSGVQVMHG